MTELNEAEITAKAQAYTERKLVHFKPFLSSYEKAILNAYIDGYVACKLANNEKIQPFLDADEIINDKYAE